MMRSELQWVFVGGLIRSGSTLQYQILKALVEGELGGSSLGFVEAWELDDVLAKAEGDPSTRFPCVIKSHVCTAGIRERLGRGSAIAFYTYRDIRDVVLSGSRNFGVPLPEYIAGRAIDDALGESALWSSCPGVFTSSFEQLTEAKIAWIREMMDALGLPTAKEFRAEELAAEFSIERQRERIRSADFKDLGGFEVDPQTLLHRRHIGEAAVGGWRRELSPAEVREIELRAGDWLIDHGYPLDTIAGEFPYRDALRSLRERFARHVQEMDLILLERERLLRAQARENEVLRAAALDAQARKERLRQGLAPVLRLRQLIRRLLGRAPQSI